MSTVVASASFPLEQMLIIKPAVFCLQTSDNIILENPTEKQIAYTVKLNNCGGEAVTILGCGLLKPKQLVEVSVKLSSSEIVALTDAECPMPSIVVLASYSLNSEGQTADVLNAKAPNEIAYTEIPLSTTDEPGRFDRKSTSRSPVKKQLKDTKTHPPI